MTEESDLVSDTEWELTGTAFYRAVSMPDRFRLMTANLLHSRSDPRAFARLIAEHDPDVVVSVLAPNRVLPGGGTDDRNAE